MKKFVREKTIFSKRLVRTTTFSATLLIAAILLFSAVVPAAMHNNTPIKMKVNKVVQTNPQLTTTITKAGPPTIKSSPAHVYFIINKEYFIFR